jgi:hypothetical protein
MKHFMSTLILVFAAGSAFSQYRAGQGGYASDPNTVFAARTGQAGYTGTAGLLNPGGNWNGQGGLATTAALPPFAGSRNGLGGLATFTTPSGLTYLPTVGATNTQLPRSTGYFSFSNPLPLAPVETPLVPRPAIHTPPPVVPYWMR